MTATADKSSDGYDVIKGSSTVTFTGRGVAPIAAVDSGQLNAGHVRIGTNSSSRIIVQNLGDGNLSNRGVLSNLHGSVGAGTGSFAGSGGSIDLADAGSVEFPYNFTPNIHGPQVATVGVAFTNGNPTGNNQAYNVNVELLGVGVGPELSTPQVPGSLIDFGVVESGQTSLQSLQVSNVTPDGDLGNLTDLTLLSASLTGPDASLFSLGLFTPGTVLSAAEALSLDLVFNPPGQAGAYQATLQLTTDQGTALGAVGQLFTYQLVGRSGVTVAGDFDMNGQLDAMDIDLLTAEVIAGTHGAPTIWITTVSWFKPIAAYG